MRPLYTAPAVRTEIESRYPSCTGQEQGGYQSIHEERHYGPLHNTGLARSLCQYLQLQANMNLLNNSRTRRQLACLKVGATVACSDACKVRPQRFLRWLRPCPGVDVQDGASRLHIWQREHQFPVKAARPPKRRVQSVWPANMNCICNGFRFLIHVVIAGDPLRTYIQFDASRRPPRVVVTPSSAYLISNREPDQSQTYICLTKLCIQLYKWLQHLRHESAHAACK